MGYPEDAVAKEVRKSKLPLPEQDKCIAELTELVNVLCDRLDPILLPQPESPSKDPGDRAEIMQSYIASELSGNNARIRRNSNKISSILERLEV